MSRVTGALRRLGRLTGRPDPADAATPTACTERVDSAELAAIAERVRWIEEPVRVLNGIILDPHQDLWERARERWRADEADAQLTWGVEISGDAFVRKLREYVPFLSGARIVEIGPGYGRFLRSLCALAGDFASYVGIELSPARVDRLQRGFAGDPRVRFVAADAELTQLDEPADVAISSLTLKHFFPTFERLAANVYRMLRPSGMLVFDLLEGNNVEFQPDWDVTFLRWYTRPEVEDILGRTGFEAVSFDEVTHVEGKTRLLVVARRAETSPAGR